MSAQTQRYGIQYPTGDDQINQIATHLQRFATTVENALGTVDDRHTEGTGKPVSRQTLAELNRLIAPAGYAGYVTNDDKNNGYYISDGRYWHKYQPAQTIHTTSISLPYMSGRAQLTRISNIVMLNCVLYASGTLQAANTTVADSIPSGYRPAYAGAIIQGMTNSNKVFWTELDKSGSMTLWGNIDANWRYSIHASWITTDEEPA